MKRMCFFVALLACMTITKICLGLAEERIGPVDKSPTQPGSPAGIGQILQHQSRVYSIWVNGNENVYFQSDGEQINALIKLFSKMRLRDHQVTIKSGRPTTNTFKGIEVAYNVNLHVLSGIALFVHKENKSPETYEPTLTIYVDPDEDERLLKQISLPDNIILNNEVKSFPLMGGATKPKRQTWHAHVRFDDDKPAADFENGISTIVTLWEKNVKQGIQLGKVNHMGYFHAAFSESEIADLKTGKSWLTLTVGNWLTKPSREDPKLAAKNLGLESDELPIVKLDRPGYFHGRILFEDGSPPVLDPKPWPGAEIALSFSYAGRATVDSKGYFKVYFTKEQFEELKAKKARKNVYIPSYENKGGSTALYSFPVSRLSKEKKTAGVVKIRKPGPRQQKAK